MIFIARKDDYLQKTTTGAPSLHSPIRLNKLTNSRSGDEHYFDVMFNCLSKPSVALHSASFSPYISHPAAWFPTRFPKPPFARKGQTAQLDAVFYIIKVTQAELLNLTINALSNMKEVKFLAPVVTLNNNLLYFYC